MLYHTFYYIAANYIAGANLIEVTNFEATSQTRWLEELNYKPYSKQRIC